MLKCSSRIIKVRAAAAHEVQIASMWLHMKKQYLQRAVVHKSCSGEHADAAQVNVDHGSTADIFCAPAVISQQSTCELV